MPLPHCPLPSHLPSPSPPQLRPPLAPALALAPLVLTPGLSLRVRLLRALPRRYRVDIRIKPGTHQSEHAVNKQLNDKERVQAALENTHLLQVVEGCLATAGRRGAPAPHEE